MTLTPEERERRARDTEKSAARREAAGGLENLRATKQQREHAAKLRRGEIG